MSDNINRINSRTPFARHSIRLAIGSILRTPQNARAELDYFYTRILDADGRPLVGLDKSDIASAAQAAILNHEPLVSIGAIDVEMTAVGAVSAIIVHYRTHETADADRIRIEFPNRSAAGDGR